MSGAVMALSPPFSLALVVVRSDPASFRPGLPGSCRAGHLLDKTVVDGVALVGWFAGFQCLKVRKGSALLVLDDGGVWLQGGGPIWWESWSLWAVLTTLVLVGFLGREGSVLTDVRRLAGASGMSHPYCPDPGVLAAPDPVGA